MEALEILKKGIEGGRITVAGLKEGLKILGLPTAGLKDDLMQRCKEGLRHRGMWKRAKGEVKSEDDDDSDGERRKLKKRLKKKAEKERAGEQDESDLEVVEPRKSKVKREAINDSD